MALASAANQGEDSPFWWGSATSAYQVEGGNIWSDWFEWEKRRGMTVCGEAVRHYQYFREDFQQAKSLGQNAHRFSIEWARLEPSAGRFATKEIERYGEVIATLRRLGLKRCLTLHHFTLPGWLAKKGGWENLQAVEFFKRYVRLVRDEFGQEIDLWLTINEPLILATQAYGYGCWPPQVRSYRRLAKVVHNLAQAHNEAYQLIHETLPRARVGLAHNFFSLEPLRRWWSFGQLACRRADRFWNQWMMDLTAGRHDFLGVNYYFHQRCRLGLKPSLGWARFADPKKLHKEVSSLGWEVYPAGLKDVLVKLWQQYALPIYVTENGISPQSEEQRASFITRSSQAVVAAKRLGASVRGYFYWSLLDNFEWHKGFTPKFGLIAVDPRTYTRTPRPGAKVYAEICSTGQVSGVVSKIKGSVHL